METQFVKGMFVKRPHEKAPDFVKLCLDINKKELIESLEAMQANERGYLKIDIKMSQKGDPYAAWNTFEGGRKKEQPSDDDIPF